MTTRFDRSEHGPAAVAPVQVAPGTPPLPPAPPVRTAAASRRTNRKLLILSILLVLLGGVVAAGAAQMLTKHTAVLALARDVPIGAAISDEDLAVANISTDAAIDPIPASQRAEVIGLIAQTHLYKNGLLLRSELDKVQAIPAGQALVPMSFKQGQLPSELPLTGQRVVIVPTVGDDGQPIKSTSSIQPISATVYRIVAPDQSTGVTVVTLLMGQDRVQDAVNLSASSHLSMFVVPLSR